jgi:very-short-patch-repair endonuclease
MTNSMDGRVEATARTQHGLVTRAQVREAGFTDEMVRQRVRSGRWWRVHPGVFAMLGADATPVFTIHAAVLAAGPDAVASHTTAAALAGLPGFDLRSKPIHLTASSYTERRRTPAKLHGTLRLPDHHRAVVAGVPCTATARTIFDLCGCLRPARSERALDHALASGLVTVAALHQVLRDTAARGRAGSTVLRRHLRKRDLEYVAPESELEARFVQLLRDHGLPEPERQVDLGDDDSWIGRVDFLYRDPPIVIECDGAQHHSSHLDRRADDARDARLEAAGWRVLRFTWADVSHRQVWVADSVGRSLRREVA